MIGIDVGSDLVRMCIRDSIGSAECCLERPLHRKVSGVKNTMSSEALWGNITTLLAEGNISIKKSDTQTKSDVQDADCPETGRRVFVAATCSMAVVEKIEVNGRKFLRPLEDDIIVWMDSRASAQAQWLSERLDALVLQQIGGQITPEMGIAKLRWVYEKYQGSGKEVLVFELYDWVSYLFAAGGLSNGMVECLQGDVGECHPQSRAMDGSVKGWGKFVLDIVFGKTDEVRIGHVPTQFRNGRKSAFCFAGEPIAKNKVLGGVVLHGCIDCYAGVVAQMAAKKCLPERVASENKIVALDMVAGTLTCFVVSIPSASLPIDGLWDPFDQLMETPVYAFGQPATGKLFEQLLGPGDTFELLESLAISLEERLGQPLVVLAKNHFYYGDRYGNRSPYGDFGMDEVRVKGFNADQNSSVVPFRNDEDEKCLRYYLLIEFLVFQTKELAQKLGPLDVVRVSGSQAKNTRFMRLLQHFAFQNGSCPVVEVVGGNATYSGARAGATIASGQGDVERRVLETEELLPEISRLLERKYKFYLELSSWQHRFRRAMR